MNRTELILISWKNMSPIPFVVIEESGEIMYASRKAVITDLGEPRKLLDRTRKEMGAYPCIDISDRIFARASFWDAEGRCYLLGPIVIGEYRENDLNNLALSPFSWYDIKRDICKGHLSRLEAQAQLMYYCITGEIQTNPLLSEKGDESEDEYKLQQYQFDNVDHEQQRNTYEEIIPLIDAVKKGDMEEFLRIYDSTLLDRTGKLAAAPLKQSEYLTIKIISLAMHAMIDGGVDYQFAYDTSDLYLQKLEKCTSIMQMRRLQMDYIRLAIESVHQLERVDYDLIEKVKKYVWAHRNKHFSITQMAEELHVNASYLSRAFSKKESITIQQFVSQERIKAACNMLSYSPYSITEIATYLCFSSQSHFSSQFRQQMGMTPSEYRKNKKMQQAYKSQIQG